MTHETVNNHEDTEIVHGATSDGWAEIYAFELLKYYPYNPKTRRHIIGNDDKGKPVGMTSETILHAMLRDSFASEGGEEFVWAAVNKGAELFRSWFVETDEGKFEFRFNTETN